MTSYPHIIVTGDSIAQLSFKSGGYGSLLADRVSHFPVKNTEADDVKYAGKLDVLNRGMGGYQSTQLVHKLQTDLIAPGADVKLFLIHIGTNDSAIGALQSITVQTYISNLKQIISHIRTNHSSSRIILLTPSTLDPKTCTEFEDTFQIPLPLRSPRLPGNTLRYVDACIKLGLEEHVPVVDCFRLHQKVLDEGGKTKDLFDDGLHYSAQGYSVSHFFIDICVALSGADLRNSMSIKPSLRSLTKACPNYEWRVCRTLFLISGCTE